MSTKDSDWSFMKQKDNLGVLKTNVRGRTQYLYSGKKVLKMNHVKMKVYLYEILPLL